MRLGAVIPWFLAALSAAGVALSYPPADLGYLAFAALAPLFLALRNAAAGQAAGLSFLFGCLYGIGIFWWLASVEGVGFPIYFLVLAPLYSLYYVAFGLSYRWAAARVPGLTLFLAPALWVSVEYARANMFFLALPWNLLAHTQHAALPVIGIADLTGVYGVSFVLVMVNEVASRWMELGIAWMGSRGNPMGNFLAPPKAPTIAVALTLVLVMTYSLARSGSASPSDTVRIALVQPNTLVTETMTYEDLETHFERYSEYTYKADDETPDLIIWPASSLPGSLSDRSVKILMGPLLRKLEAPLLAGGAGGEKMSPAQGDRRSYANTEFLLRPGGRPGGQYAKQHLVPFNEYLPLDGVFHWPRWVTTLEGNYRAGDKYTVFVLKEGRFGVPICWESLFPDLFRRFVNKGARFMVNVTNEAYMGDSAGPYQTLAMNIFRAVENRVTLARAATTGISAFIGPDGRVLGTVRSTDGKELFVAGILVRDIPLLVKRTFYTKHGDVFAWTIIAISLLGLAVALRSRPVKGI